MVSIEPRAFTYLWNPPNNQLTPGQEIVAATVSVDVDSDFLLTAMFLSLYTGQFQFQVLDSFDYYCNPCHHYLYGRCDKCDNY